jgi:tRNA(fMet)-specific endonuclease VapC
MLYILDTDHISLLQRGHAQVRQKIAGIDIANRAVTIISATEQIQGRMAVIRRVKDEFVASRSFFRLQETLNFYAPLQVLAYSEEAAQIFQSLRQQKIRIGTQDLRIASIALSFNAIVATRNSKDFAKVPNLIIEDWSNI